MKKINLFICSMLFGLLLFSGCVSQPKPNLLDLSTITEDIPIYTISVIVGKNDDTDGTGEEFFQRIFVEQIDTIAIHLASKGINADIQRFKNELNSSPEIKFEKMRIASTFILHRYYWRSQTRPETRLDMAMPFIVMGNGSMLLEYAVRKDDPLYKPGYLLKDTMNITFSN